MIALTWIISAAICAPIALGMNYTEARASTPKLCVFYNSEFLICSSLGSFYIPCIIMIFLYYRIFKAIHLRAKQNAMKMATKKVTKSQASAKNVIENKACKAQVLKSYNERAGDRLAHHNDGSCKPLVSGKNGHWKTTHSHVLPKMFPNCISGILKSVRFPCLCDFIRTRNPYVLNLFWKRAPLSEFSSKQIFVCNVSEENQRNVTLGKRMSSLMILIGL